jgi:hypothetical protein
MGKYALEEMKEKAKEMIKGVGDLEKKVQELKDALGWEKDHIVD